MLMPSSAEYSGNHMMIAEESYDSRLLVETELKLHGIRVVSPPSKFSPPQPGQPMDCCVDNTSDNNDDNDADDDGFFMTEDEVIALMEEIEWEWKQQQQNLLEEEINRIEGEEQAVFEAIAEYEQWNDERDEGRDTILCPLCQEANLTTSNSAELGDDIVCPNHMDGSCPLRLEARQGLSLQNLKERLAYAISAHGETCGGKVAFEVSEERPYLEHSVLRLWATCSACGSKACLV